MIRDYLSHFVRFVKVKCSHDYSTVDVDGFGRIEQVQGLKVKRTTIMKGVLPLVGRTRCFIVGGGMLRIRPVNIRGHRFLINRLRTTISSRTSGHFVEMDRFDASDYQGARTRHSRTATYRRLFAAHREVVLDHPRLILTGIHCSGNFAVHRFTSVLSCVLQFSRHVKFFMAREILLFIIRGIVRPGQIVERFYRLHIVRRRRHRFNVERC